VLSAANQSALDASLTDSIELYHLAGAYDKVVETVNRALGHSLSMSTSSATSGEKISSSLGLGTGGAFGGLGDDLYGLAGRVWGMYEKDFGKRNGVSRGGWETLGMLLRLKKALSEYAAQRPDLALEVGLGSMKMRGSLTIESVWLIIS
jgi:nuclear pore complex protein Nup93